MKQCVSCEKTMGYEMFYKNGRSYLKQCKTCFIFRVRNHYLVNKTHNDSARKAGRRTTRRRNSEYILAYLRSHPCIDCGLNDTIVLDFDHIKGTKKANVVKLAHDSYSINIIKREIAKCVVRCANCHRRKTAKERLSFRYMMAFASNT